MKILHLTLKKKWFGLIASGKKTIEYREVKDYWRRRLMLNPHEFKAFDEIHFRNGYNPNGPFMRTGLFCILVANGKYHKPDNGEKLKGMQFTIFIGKILEIKNYKQA